MTNAIKWIKSNKWTIIVTIFCLTILIFIHLYNLSSITNDHLSATEIATINSSNSLQKIITNPLYAPHKLLLYFAIKINPTSIFLLRMSSVILGIFFVILFYNLLKRWFSPKVALITTTMLASSSFYLNYSRLAISDILLPLSLLSLMWAAWWMYDKTTPNWTLVPIFAGLVMTLYVPGIIWFFILIIFVERYKIKKILGKLSPLILFNIVIITGILLLPICYAVFKDYSILLSWLGISKNFIIVDFIKQFIFVPASLTVRSLPNPATNLGRLPLLNLATLVFAALGAYMYFYKLKLIRTRILIGAFLISWILIALNNGISIILLLPLIYLTVAAGITMLLSQWYFVFPKNPVARNMGLFIISSVIAISVLYNFNRYYRAWANSPISQAAFDQKPPNLLQ